MYPLHAITLAVTLLSTPALAWGTIGHRTIGYLAEKYFTSDAATLFQDLVAPDDRFDISDAAVWADNHRSGSWAYTGPWHYIDAKDDPPNHCEIHYNPDCPRDTGCIISAIKNMTARVNNMSLDYQDQRNATKFLFHFVGDVHQPLHTEDKCKGGNNLMVKFDGERVKLHGVWDKEIIQKLLGYDRPAGDQNNKYEKGLAKAWADELHERARMREGMGAGDTQTAECTSVRTAQKCALAWATEANWWVCKYVLKDGKSTGRDRDEDDCFWKWNGPADVGGEYYEGAVPIVEDLVSKAGARLGAWMNGLARQRAALMRGEIGDGDLVSQDEEWEL